MKNTILSIVAFISLFILVSGASASSILITDSDPFTLDQYVGSTDLRYNHNISDNGYNPLTDTVSAATLSIKLIDDEDENVTAVAQYDFVAVDAGEMSVTEGDQLIVLWDADGSLFVKNEDGVVGYVPTNYLPLDEYSTWLSESFQLSFDGIAQSIHQINDSWPVTEDWYQFTVPTAYLFDGSLDLNIHAATGDFIFQDALLTVTIEKNSLAPVPEPATFILLGSGLAGLAFYRRKRK